MTRIVRILDKVLNYLGWQVLRILDRTPAQRLIHRRTAPGRRRRPECVWRSSGPAVVEPETGYVIVEPRRLEMGSMDALNGLQPAWAVAVPRVRSWSDRNGPPRKTVEFDDALSLRHLFEWNYFHFFFDVLGKLALYDQLSLLDDHPPLVVGAYAGELAFCRDLMRMGQFGEMNWYVQPRDTCVRAQLLVSCRARLSYAVRARYVVDRLGLDRGPGLGDERKILQVRRPPATRQIVNLDEVEELAAGFDYETVDTAGWPLADQIGLFQRTRSLVAIHGAGMTNMMFRVGQRMSVVELCSDAWAPGNFMTMATEFGYEFSRLTFPAAPGPGQAANFRVDVEVLEHTLRSIEHSL